MGNYVVVEKGTNRLMVTDLSSETVRNLQRLGGRLTDGQTAGILVRRLLCRDEDGATEAADANNMHEAMSLGLWDPQAGEATT